MKSSNRKWEFCNLCRRSSTIGNVMCKNEDTSDQGLCKCVTAGRLNWYQNVSMGKLGKKRSPSKIFFSLKPMSSAGFPRHKGEMRFQHAVPAGAMAHCGSLCPQCARAGKLADLGCQESWSLWEVSPCLGEGQKSGVMSELMSCTLPVRLISLPVITTAND